MKRVRLTAEQRLEVARLRNKKSKAESDLEMLDDLRTGITDYYTSFGESKHKSRYEIILHFLEMVNDDIAFTEVRIQTLGEHIVSIMKSAERET